MSKDLRLGAQGSNIARICLKHRVDIRQGTVNITTPCEVLSQA